MKFLRLLLIAALYANTLHTADMSESAMIETMQRAMAEDAQARQARALERQLRAQQPTVTQRVRDVMSPQAEITTDHLTYEARAELATNPVARQLFSAMARKRTNLALAASMRDPVELLGLVKTLGHEICALTMNTDVLSDFNGACADALLAAADAANIIILEDRAFTDSGVAKLQFTGCGNTPPITRWADAVTVHAIAGPGTLETLATAASGRGYAAVLIAELDTPNNLITPAYTAAALTMAQANPFVMGFIARNAVCADRKLVKFTHVKHKDHNDPAYGVKNRLADVMIVGPDIYQARDPLATAQSYRTTGWQAYENRIGEARLAKEIDAAYHARLSNDDLGFGIFD